MKPKSPCKDCPDHQFGCRPGCDKWAAFEEAKQAEYARRKAEAEATPGKPEFEHNIRRKMIMKARFNR